MGRLSDTAVAVCLTLFMLMPGTGGAAEYLTVELPGGQEIPVRYFQGGGDTAIVWLPSEYGSSVNQEKTAARLVSWGHDVWLADLHSAYFVPPGRDSVQEFSVSDAVELANHILATGKRHLLFLSSGKAAALALRAGRQLQQQQPGRTDIRGFLLLSPYLYQGRPRIGQDARFLSIVHETNLPVFVLQPGLSEKAWWTGGLVDALESGGSEVVLQEMEGVQSGFEWRPDTDLTPMDLDARDGLAGLLDRNIARMLEQELPVRAAAAHAKVGYVKKPVAEPQLFPYAGPQNLPDIVLTDLKGRQHTLSSYRGKVVLINFWATWCPPCVHEIPSLSQLQARMDDRPFQLLSINVGEDKDAIDAFMRKTPIDFPVLLDSKGRALKSWKVYAYPSNYLLDANGRIRFAYYGALDWVAPRVTDVVDTLVSEIAR